MITLPWLWGRFRRHSVDLLATAAGVAVTVALLATLASFVAYSKSTMTARSISQVPVDWQVQAAPGTSAADVLTGVRADRVVRAALPVDFARTTGLRATTGGTEQITGPGFVVGLPDGYSSTFPAMIRPLLGDANGVAVAQQTAANLHVAPGDRVTIGRVGLPPATVTIDGIIDLPAADSLFQVVGAPAGAAPSAPPDNVVVMPASTWRRLFDRQAAISSDAVTYQVHARIDRALPNDPAAAFSVVEQRAKHLEASLAGGGRVGDNLAAALDTARGDALYAQVLFVFLAVPGALLAALLTATVAGVGRERRRREQALLRTRGATVGRIVWLSSAESMVVAMIGAVLGLAAARVAARVAFASTALGASAAGTAQWAVAAVLAAFLTAAAAIAIPAWADARHLTVGAARTDMARRDTARWNRLPVGAALFGLGVLLVWLTSRGGYKIVVAPEGVPSISVNYWAFAGPALLWVGGAIIAARLAEIVAGHGRSVVAAVVRPAAGPLADTVAATMQRQRRLLARGAVLVALTATFAASTAIFNATFEQQSQVDAILTNGADVTVRAATTTPSAETGRTLQAIPGVRRVEAVRHRYAYVGTDLQDLYGVDPTTIVKAGKLQDAYFRGASARDIMRALAQRPDGVVVSAETARDYQLQPGDRVNLRLLDARTHRYVAVPFRYVAIAAEFPTAPRDSFLLANTDYIAAQTHDPAISTFLVDTGGRNQGRVAAAIRARLGPAVQVSDLAHTRRVVASSLTAVDLHGLTRVELAFAVLLAAAATGLVLWLGFSERRRAFAITRALGARRSQIGAFVWSEAGYVAIAGLVIGAAGGLLLSQTLVKILNGVFDPPPAHLAIPWGYLALTAVVAIVASIVASILAIADASRGRIELLRAI